MPPAPKLSVTSARARALPEPPEVLFVSVAGGVTPTLLDASAEPVGVAESLASVEPVGVAESVGVDDSVGGDDSVGVADSVGQSVGLPVTSKHPLPLGVGCSDAELLGISVPQTAPTAQLGSSGWRGKAAPLAPMAGASENSIRTAAAATASRAGRAIAGADLDGVSIAVGLP
ncbi:MAG: hypothetical protein ACHQZR_04870, partial [Candidatus Limnocylindrales bacterium]